MRHGADGWLHLSPEKLINAIAGALRPGGVAIFHEYIDYRTWRLAPRRPAVESFVKEVMESWRATGGEPDVALIFPTLFRAAGLRIVEAQPRILTVSPRDEAWQWPASFIEINLARLQQLGRVDSDWVEAVRREFREAESDPVTLLNTPMFLEIIARRE
jgi:SAM-dependent methyltransferase